MPGAWGGWVVEGGGRAPRVGRAGADHPPQPAPPPPRLPPTHPPPPRLQAPYPSIYLQEYLRQVRARVAACPNFFYFTAQ